MKKLLIVTDLDASLIDDNYQYTEATEAIKELAERGFPLVLNSSKTLSEMKSLAQELELTTPLIAENGGIVAVPNVSEVAKYCDQAKWQEEGDYQTMITGLSREYVLHHAHSVREERGYSFTGFSDMSDQELSDLTGLTEPEVTSQLYRHCYPNIEWTSVALGDSANDLAMLEAADIAITIPHADGIKVQVSGTHNIQAKYPASKGWNDSILSLLTTT